MKMGKISTFYINKSDDKVLNSENKAIFFVISSFFALLYVMTMIFQAIIPTEKNMGGIISQIQVMISTYLVVRFKRYGFLIAVILNIIESAMAARAYFVLEIESALSGIIIPICAIITLSIISYFGSRLSYKLNEVIEQKKELYGLYEELTASEEEIRNQNFKLIEYNNILEEKEKKLDYLAFIDVLTELPNRKMIINRLDFLVKLYTNKKESFAVIFIDLDNFKRINDMSGHHVGDLLLQAAALRLQNLVHEEDMLGRLGGDEFALIIQRKLKEVEILEYIECLRIVLLESFQIENMEFNISASFGIAIYPQDGHDSSELLKCADTAMYKAKDYGKNVVLFYNKDMKDEIYNKIEFENQLNAALGKDEIYLVFQPQYESVSKQLRGFEALARWESAKLGSVSPIDFISVAEETGLIIPMGEWIFRTACNMIKRIQIEYKRDVIISVNISSVQIMNPSFIQMVVGVLEETKVSGRCIEIEVTESVFISSVESVIDVFVELKKLGILIALDDFGTGYSSLSYLQKLPIDTLKIDKSFIDSINNADSSKQIVGSIISLVHKMDILVVAEGVENEQQLEYLKKQECDFIQGFLWGKPLDEKDLFLLL